MTDLFAAAMGAEAVEASLGALLTALPLREALMLTMPLFGTLMLRRHRK